MLKKIVLCFAAITFLISTGVYAAVPSVKNSVVSVDNYSVNFSVELEPAGVYELLLFVVKPGKTLSVPADYDDLTKIFHKAVLKTNANGTVSCPLTMMTGDDEGEYTYLLGITGASPAYKRTFNYFSPDLVQSIVQAVKDCGDIIQIIDLLDSGNTPLILDCAGLKILPSATDPYTYADLNASYKEQVAAFLFANKFQNATELKVNFNAMTAVTHINQASPEMVEAVLTGLSGTLGIDLTTPLYKRLSTVGNAKSLFIAMVSAEDFKVSAAADKYQELKVVFSEFQYLALANAALALDKLTLMEIIDDYVDNLKISPVSKWKSLSEGQKIKVCEALYGRQFTMISSFGSAVITAINALPAEGGNPSGQSPGGGSASGGGTIGGLAPGGGSMVIQPSYEAPFMPAFVDLDSVPWAKDAIYELARLSIIDNVLNFNPDFNITREEFLKMTLNSLDIKGPYGECSFADVKRDAWYYNYVALAEENGIIEGYDGIFGIGDNITRQDMAVILKRAIDRINVTLPSTISGIIFDDDDQIADYAKEAVMYFCGSGIINGMGDNSFAPLSNLTRAQAAVMLGRIMKICGTIRGADND